MPAGRADVGSCAHNQYFRRTDLSLTDFRYEPLFLWRSHANLQDPAYPGAVEDPVDRSMPEPAVIVAATWRADERTRTADLLITS
jgi:hypothetical protein